MMKKISKNLKQKYLRHRLCKLIIFEEIPPHDEEEAHGIQLAIKKYC